MTKSLKSYASLEIDRFITNVVNNVIDNEFLEEFENSEGTFFTQIRNNDGSVNYTDIDEVLVNKLLNDAIKIIEEDLIKIENGDVLDLKLPDNVINDEYNKLKKGIVITIPTGSLFNNASIANLGPKIPVKISILGNVSGDVEVKVSDYGINNSLIEVYMNIFVVEKIVLPISSKEIKTDVRIPIGARLIHGEVPKSMLGGYTYTNK